MDIFTGRSLCTLRLARQQHKQSREFTAAGSDIALTSQLIFDQPVDLAEGETPTSQRSVLTLQHPTFRWPLLHTIASPLTNVLKTPTYITDLEKTPSKSWEHRSQRT